MDIRNPTPAAALFPIPSPRTPQDSVHPVLLRRRRCPLHPVRRAAGKTRAAPPGCAGRATSSTRGRDGAGQQGSHCRPAPSSLARRRLVVVAVVIVQVVSLVIVEVVIVDVIIDLVVIVDVILVVVIVDVIIVVIADVICIIVIADVICIIVIVGVIVVVVIDCSRPIGRTACPAPGAAAKAAARTACRSSWSTTVRRRAVMVPSAWVLPYTSTSTSTCGRPTTVVETVLMTLSRPPSRRRRPDHPAHPGSARPRYAPPRRGAPPRRDVPRPGGCLARRARPGWPPAAGAPLPASVSPGTGCRRAGCSPGGQRSSDATHQGEHQHRHRHPTPRRSHLPFLSCSTTNLPGLTRPPARYGPPGAFWPADVADRRRPQKRNPRGAGGLAAPHTPRARVC